jgi:hypothetical protein
MGSGIQRGAVHSLQHTVVRGADAFLNIPGIIGVSPPVLKCGVVREIEPCRERFQVFNRNPDVVTEILDYGYETI